MAQKINWTQIETSIIPKDLNGNKLEISIGGPNYENYLKSLYSDILVTKKIDAETYEIPTKTGNGFNKVILWNPVTKEVTFGDRDSHVHNNINTLNKLSELGNNLTFNNDVVLTERNVINYVVNDKNYVHDQGVPSSLWTIYHDLKKECSVTVKDSADTEVSGCVKINNGIMVVIEFNAPFSGKATLN